MERKKLIRKISLILMLCVMITILPAYKAQAGTRNYGVTIWTTDANFVNGLGAPHGPGTTYLTEMKKFYEGQDANVNLINGGHLSSDSLDGINLLWVFLPNVNFNATDITYMGDFLATGGRIVFCGEHPGFFLQGDGYISSAVASLGGNFTILPQMHSPTSGVITGSKLSTGSSLTDGVTGFYFAAAAKIAYSGRAKVVLNALDNLPFAVDQSVGKGRITLFTDINIWDPIVQSSPSQGTRGSNNGVLFANLMKDAKENQNIVSEGGDPNKEQVATPTADQMSGNILSGSTVTLSSVTTGAAIHFTTDLQEPNAGSTTGSAVTITGTVGSQVTVKAIATKTGMSDSDVATFTYTISGVREPATTSAAVTYTLNYTAGEGGTVTGQLLQMVSNGETGSLVTAVPNANYHFVKWSDGKTNPSRKDTYVGVNIQVRAIFEVNSSKSSSSSSSNGTKASSPKQITVNVTDGSNDKSVSKTVIERITASDGTKKDTVTYTADKAKETIAALLNEGKHLARIVAADGDQAVVETKINIPKDTLSALSNGNINLEIETNGVRLALPKTSIQDLSENGQLSEDLYFRVVPIKDEAKQQLINTTANNEMVIKAVSGKDGVQILGTPMTIETNMSKRNVDIILPLTGVKLPSDPTEREAFLKELGVFIEHSDGEKVLEKGEIVEYLPGVLGLKFTVNKFSTFTVVKLNQKATTGAWENNAQGWKYIKDGQPAIGWNLINGYWYLMDSTGIMETGWRQTNGTWYLLNNDGSMAIGWKQINGYWYLLNTNGAMITGWKQVNGNWYYLYEDGSMASNTVVDGYTVDENGVLI